MPEPQPSPIELTDRQRAALEQIVRRQQSPQCLVRRAQIILQAASESNNSQIGRV